MNTTKYSVGEEIANTISHGLGALLSVAALTLLINNAYISHDAAKMISFIIYGTSLILLFLASTIYHAVTHQKAKKLFKLFDHCAIYFLIAGTYTPLMLVTLHTSLGYWLLGIIWFIALAGVFFKIKYGHQYKVLSLMTYVGMGAISLTIIHKLQQTLSDAAIYLLAIGGLIYLAGIFFYVQKKIPYNHAIWHLFVLAGATCHFLMIYLYV
ncbi:MAG: hemolysin III family protein [Alteromonadaceae bacterium]|nr:hemolysin III family protein [Alteromonadaceae bacterium]